MVSGGITCTTSTHFPAAGSTPETGSSLHLQPQTLAMSKEEEERDSYWNLESAMCADGTQRAATLFFSERLPGLLRRLSGTPACKSVRGALGLILHYYCCKFSLRPSLCQGRVVQSPTHVAHLTWFSAPLSPFLPALLVQETCLFLQGPVLGTCKHCLALICADLCRSEMRGSLCSHQKLSTPAREWVFSEIIHMPERFFLW